MCNNFVIRIKQSNNNENRTYGVMMSGATMATTTTTPPTVDMSTKVGGRVFYPALPVVDGSYPTEIEKSFQKTLDEFCKDNIPLEDVQGIQRRERVLSRMRTICREWIRSVCIAKGLPSDVVDNAGGQLFTSGSYRLGVHEPGADIDTILVAPSCCRRQDFFGTITTSSIDETTNTTITTVQRDPNSLAERIRSHPDVTNFVPVEGAAVPLLTFDWEGINIDLLFARLNQSTTVPADFDIDNDAVLDGADSATEKSLNGPRVTNLIAAIVSGTPERYQTFLTVVRCVRKWAKVRGLYSNKMGYWGGVNINIGVALAIQLYPNSCAASLLRKFFLIFKTWRWPQPLMLTKPHDAGYGLPVWSPTQGHMNKTAVAVAPMITPAYPAMNSTLSVSRQTLQILQEEFNRAHAIVDTIWKDFMKQPKNVTAQSWKQLYEPSDFFISYPLYLSLCIVGPSQADVQSWAGFVESRLRKLVSDLLCRSLPIKKIQLWPKKIEACIADKTALLTYAQRQNCITYFIGYMIDKNRIRGEQKLFNIELPLQNFREWDLSRFQPLVNGMDVLVKSFTTKLLPQICFTGIYEGGKNEAMQKRRTVRNNDPIRIEKKRIQRLEELKAKMAKIEEKKRNKRKREEEEEEEDDDAVEEAAEGREPTEDATTAPTEEVQPAVVESEETDLLENALDTIQDDSVDGENAKRREEGEQDRQTIRTATSTDDMDEEEHDEEKAKIAYEKDNEYEEMAYTGEDARDIFLGKTTTMNNTNNTNNEETQQLDQSVQQEQDDQNQFVHKDIRSLPIPKDVFDLFYKNGYHFVSDDEMIVIGSSTDNNNNNNNNNSSDANNNTDGDCLVVDRHNTGTIKFLTKFDNVIELDPYGNVIDMGDEDYMPSKQWIGQKIGFEFKLGLRGLGYYRTGKEVIVPSNVAY